MGNRLNAIYDSLCRQGRSTTVDELAQQLGVTTRTVYSDIDRLNALLRPLELGEIANTHGVLAHKGRLNLEFAQVVGTKELLYIDPELRRRRMAEAMLTQPAGFSVEMLQEQFGVSRNTVMRDLNVMRKTFSKAGVSVSSKPFVGFLVEGDETDVRELLALLLADDRAYLEGSGRDISRVFEHANLLVRRLEEALSARFTDGAADHLANVIVASWCRVSAGHLVTDGAVLPEHTHEMQAVTACEDQVRALLGTGDVRELSYLANRVREVSLVNSGELVHERWVEMNLLVDRFVRLVDSQTPEANFVDDQLLYQGVLNHLRPAYWRAVRGQVVENPMLDFVRKECDGLHAAVMRSISAVEDGLGIAFSEEEVGFFTLFFAASLERSHRSLYRRVSAVVVCREGIATSQLLRAQLDAAFDVSVVECLGVRELDGWLARNEVDLIVSTVPLEIDGRDVVVVSAALGEDDRAALRGSLESHVRPVAVDEIMRIVEQHVYLDAETSAAMADELGSYLGIRPRRHEKKGRYQPMLKEVLTKDLVEAKYHAKDRNAAVREAGRLLVDKGVAAPQYVEAMIENVEVNGTYIVIAPGIAMPHARPERGAQGIGFSVLTLDEPVVFGHPANDPVSLVVALCAVDHQTHLRALSELVEVLGDEEKVRQIGEASSADEIMHVIEGSN